MIAEPSYTGYASFDHVRHAERELERLANACILTDVASDEVYAAIMRHAAIPPSSFVSALALRLRTAIGIRAVPMVLLVALVDRDDTADISLTEIFRHVVTDMNDLVLFFALYWRTGHKPVSGRIRRAAQEILVATAPDDLIDIAATANRPTVADIIRISHAVPSNPVQESCWKLIRNLTRRDLRHNRLRSQGTIDVRRTHAEHLLRNRRLPHHFVLTRLAEFEELNCAPKILIDYLSDPALISGSDVNTWDILRAYFLSGEPSVRDTLEHIYLMKMPVNNVPKRTLVLIDGTATEPIRAAFMASVLQKACADTYLVWGTHYPICCADTGIDIVERIMATHAIVRMRRHTGVPSENINAAIAALSTGMYARVVVFTEDMFIPVPCPIENGYVVLTTRNGPIVHADDSWTYVSGTSQLITTYIRSVESWRAVYERIEDPARGN